MSLSTAQLTLTGSSMTFLAVSTQQVLSARDTPLLLHHNSLPIHSSLFFYSASPAVDNYNSNTHTHTHSFNTHNKLCHGIRSKPFYSFTFSFILHRITLIWQTLTLARVSSHSQLTLYSHLARATTVLLLFSLSPFQGSKSRDE